MESEQNNFAYIDGQNLNLGVKSIGWSLDFKRFRIYLREKYGPQKHIISWDSWQEIKNYTTLFRSMDIF